MLVEILKAMAPAALQALRAFLASEEGKKFVAEARGELVKALLSGKPFLEDEQRNGE